MPTLTVKNLPKIGKKGENQEKEEKSGRLFYFAPPDRVDYTAFQLILPMHFHLMRSSVNSSIPRVFHRQLHCVFIEVDFEK